MNKSEFVYVTYIRTTADRVWSAITDPQVTRQFWRHSNISDWKPGSSWAHRRNDNPAVDDIVGKVIEAAPPTRLVISWALPREAADPSRYSRVTFHIETLEAMVKLTVVHDELEAGSSMANSIAGGWPAVLSSMKSLLETGEAIDLNKVFNR